MPHTADMPLSSSTARQSPTKNTIDTLEHFKTSKLVSLPTASPDEECCICLEPYDASHKAVTVLVKNCYHRFGEECLERYLDSKSGQSNKCPQCRQEWYMRESAAANSEDTSSTDPWIAEDLPTIQARPGSRPTTHRIRQTARQEEAMYHGIVEGHVHEALHHAHEDLYHANEPLYNLNRALYDANTATYNANKDLNDAIKELYDANKASYDANKDLYDAMKELYDAIKALYDTI